MSFTCKQGAPSSLSLLLDIVALKKKWEGRGGLKEKHTQMLRFLLLLLLVCSLSVAESPPPPASDQGPTCSRYIAIAFDVSGSLSAAPSLLAEQQQKSNAEQMKTALRGVIETQLLNQEGLCVALDRFATTAGHALGYTSVTDVASFTSAVETLQFEMEHPDYYTNWEAALHTLHRHRPVPSVAYLITDGMPTTRDDCASVDQPCDAIDENMRRAVEASRRLQLDNVTVIAVGFGPNVNASQLAAISGPCGNSACIQGVNYHVYPSLERFLTGRVFQIGGAHATTTTPVASPLDVPVQTETETTTASTDTETETANTVPPETTVEQDQTTTAIPVVQAEDITTVEDHTTTPAAASTDEETTAVDVQPETTATSTEETTAVVDVQPETTTTAEETTVAPETSTEDDSTTTAVVTKEETTTAAAGIITTTQPPQTTEEETTLSGTVQETTTAAPVEQDPSLTPQATVDDSTEMHNDAWIIAVIIGALLGVALIFLLVVICCYSRAPPLANKTAPEPEVTADEMETGLASGEAQMLLTTMYNSVQAVKFSGTGLKND